MSHAASNCPNCGAPVEFRWSSAVQTVCRYCRSILVRQDVNLARVGEVADLPADISPIQIATEGRYRNQSFIVTGRILYEYEQGSWNEWHVVFNNGSSGWLSDAQAEYAVSLAAQPASPLPARDGIWRGRIFEFAGVRYQVTTLTEAHYRGVEGELPFQYWDKDEVLFADLGTSDARCGTIDYSEEPPLLFLGEMVEFDDLKLSRLRSIEGWS